LWYGLFAIALWLVVAVVARPRCAATRAERRRPMPGDAVVPDPMFTVTHAMTIEAPPERVWPWLSQMGSDRAGWYSYDRIDNGGRRSATRIIPELQDITPGDVLPAVPGARDAFVVASVEPPRDLVLTVPGRGGAGVIMSWEHLLEPLDRRRTRLIVRGRVSRQWSRMARQAATPGRGPIFIERVYHVLGRLPRWLLIAVAGPGHAVMEAHHLRGIKRRAEAA
jgi:proline iminopeptidase